MTRVVSILLDKELPVNLRLTIMLISFLHPRQSMDRAVPSLTPITMAAATGHLI
jgi:hypothetical protein